MMHDATITHDDSNHTMSTITHDASNHTQYQQPHTMSTITHDASNHMLCQQSHTMSMITHDDAPCQHHTLCQQPHTMPTIAHCHARCRQSPRQQSHTLSIITHDASHHARCQQHADNYSWCASSHIVNNHTRCRPSCPMPITHDANNHIWLAIFTMSAIAHTINTRTSC